MKTTLFRRFLLRFIPISLAGLLILALVAVGLLQAGALRRETDYLRTRATMIGELLDAVVNQETSMQELNRQIRSISLNESYRVMLLAETDEISAGRGGPGPNQGSTGSLRHGMMDLFTDREQALTELTGLLTDGQLQQLSQSGGQPVVIRTYKDQLLTPSLVCGLLTDAGLLLIWLPADAAGSLLSGGLPLLAVLILTFMLIGLISAAVAAASFRRLLRPFAEISRVADSIISGQYDARLTDYPEEELQTLAISVNRMVARLQELDNARLDFIAQIAHELRTPLTILRMSLQGILDQVISPDEIPEFLRTSLKETDRLEALTTDLIDLSLAEGGTFPIELQTFDLAGLLDSVVAGVKPLADRNQQQLITDYPSEMTISADPARIRQVLLNLLSNSLKYAGDGAMIELHAEIRSGQLHLWVRDNGPGISPDELSRLFTKYSRRAGRAGAGLGLVISRAIIEAHGGRISANSDGQSYTQIDWTIPA